MIIDIIYLILLCLFIYKGYHRGFIFALCSVTAIIIGIIGALKLSGLLSGTLIEKSPSLARWAPLITYILVFSLLVWLIRIGAKIVQKFLEMVALGFLNRLAGAILYGFLISFIFSGFLWISVKMDLFHGDILAQSKAFPILEPLAPLVVTFMGHLLPFFQSAFEDLNHFFDQVKQILPNYVGTS